MVGKMRDPRVSIMLQQLAAPGETDGLMEQIMTKPEEHKTIYCKIYPTHVYVDQLIKSDPYLHNSIN